MTGVLEENKMSKDSNGHSERSILARVGYSFLWFAVIVIMTRLILGGIIGAVAGGSTEGFGSGYSVGKAASIDFFQKYGSIVFVAQIIVTAALAVLGVLPGTRKFKVR